MGRKRQRLHVVRVASVVPQQQPVLGRTAPAHGAARDVHPRARADRVPALFE